MPGDRHSWPVPAEALGGPENGVGGDLPVHRHDLYGQHGNHQRSNQGKGVAKQVDHRSLLFGLLRERADGRDGNMATGIILSSPHWARWRRAAAAASLCDGVGIPTPVL